MLLTSVGPMHSTSLVLDFGFGLQRGVAAGHFSGVSCWTFQRSLDEAKAGARIMDLVGKTSGGTTRHRNNYVLNV
eukprot:36490-Amphidinium_carterae.1